MIETNNNHSINATALTDTAERAKANICPQVNNVREGERVRAHCQNE